MLLAPTSKSEWRRYLITQRQQLTPEQRLVAQKNIINELLQQSFWKSANKVASYAATITEVNLDLLHEVAWTQKKQLYLPVLAGEQLLFCPYTSLTPMQYNQYAILEPTFKPNDCIPIENLDLVLLPAVGIDQTGVRLGMGKGYYDKSLQSKPKAAPPLLLGIIFDCQLVEKLPAEPTDIRVDKIITEIRSI